MRLKIDDDLNIIYKLYKQENFDVESWNDTIIRYINRLNNLEKESLNIINDILNKYKTYIPLICHSGGKDSTVLYELVRKIKNVKVMFNNTSNESADTYKYIKSLTNYFIANPKEGFWQLLKRENFIPSRFARACCNIYKHKLTLDNLNPNEKYLLFMGIRNEESNTRSEYQYEHQFNYYPEGWICGLPIRKWTELDVWLYIIKNNINFNKIYRYGYSRCGCIICPYRTKLEDALTKYHFPKQVERFKNMQKSNFFAYQRWTNLNCTLSEFIKFAWKGGKVRDNPTKEVIKEFADFKGISVELAERYFNQNCECGNHVNDIAIGLNMKLYGRNIKKFKCLKCLASDLGKKQKELKQLAKEFKNQGCNLF